MVVLGSVAGSPGVSRLAIGLAAAWPDADRARVVVEADPDGGRLAAELGVGAEPGLMALALAARSAGLAPGDLVERGAATVADWHLIPAPPSPEQAHSALAHAAGALSAVMAAEPTGPVWIVDGGRLSTRSPALPFARAADHVVVVTGGGFPALQLVPHRVDALRRAGCTTSVAVAAPTSWSAQEIADFAGADVVAVLPRVAARHDRLAAMRGAAWRTWWRAVEVLAGYLDAAATATAAAHVHRDALADTVSSAAGGPADAAAGEPRRVLP